MQRYEDFNLKVQSFTLMMENMDNYDTDSEWDAKDMKFAVELISKAMKMGTVDFNFRFFAACNSSKVFTLPLDVLESETLISLSLFWCTIELGQGGKVNCLGLKSLNLDCVKINNSEILWNSCPLIEKFVLRGKSLGSLVDGPNNMYQLCNLRSLMLYLVDVNPSFFSDLSIKFPFLKDLSLWRCGGYDYKGIKICSHSLEYISFVQSRLLRAHCEVPRIRTFKCNSSTLPALYFRKASKEWESYITVECSCATIDWFLKLNTLLTRLSMSRVTLSLDFRGIKKEDIDLQSLPRTAVENLKIYAASTICCALMDCLFQICRPKFIALWFPFSVKMVKWLSSHSVLTQNLGKRFAPAVRENCSMTEQNVSVVQDLEEVNVQLFEMSLAEWRPLSWKTFLDELSASKNKKTFLDNLYTSKNKQIVRFQLRWRPELSHSSDVNLR